MTTGNAWRFHNPVRVIFGPGQVEEVAAHAGDRPLLITTRGTRSRVASAAIRELLSRAVVFDGVESNPTIEAVQDAIDELRPGAFDTVVGLGGGSAIDFAKVVSRGIGTDAFDVASALAEPGRRWASTRPVATIAIPTTAGTGSEVTPFATLWSGATRRKASLGTPHPSVAIVDPELALSVPWEVTLSTGLDALTQCIEAIANRNATPITTALATRGVRLVPDAIRHLMSAPDGLSARTAMAEAALLSGLAISQTRTGLAHSMSYPVTAHLGLPHGLACALHLPAVVGFIAEDDEGALVALARAVGLAAAGDLREWLLRLYRDLRVVDAIRAHVPDVGALRPLVAEMVDPERADNSPRPIREGDVERLLDDTAGWLDRSERST